MSIVTVRPGLRLRPGDVGAQPVIAEMKTFEVGSTSHLPWRHGLTRPDAHGRAQPAAAAGRMLLAADRGLSVRRHRGHREAGEARSLRDRLPSRRGDRRPDDSAFAGDARLQLG